MERQKKENVEYESRQNYSYNMPFHFSLYQNWSSDDNKDFYTNCHSEIEIIYTVVGPEAICINNDTYIAQPGDLTVINSGHIHTGIGEHWCHHTLIPSNDFLIHLNISIPMFSITPHIRDEKLSELFLDIIREVEVQKPYHKEMARVAAERFLLALLRDYGTNRIKTLSKYTNTSEFEITSQVLNYLNCHFEEDFSIDEISKSIGISSPYMCRSVKHVTGVSIIDHLNMIRCRAAHHYLIHTDKPINEIASLCGFNGRSYFAKIYRRVMGTSPSEVDRTTSSKVIS